jgi:hypothetical protein
MVGIRAAGWAEDLIFKHGILLSFVVLSMTGDDERKGGEMICTAFMHPLPASIQGKIF